MNRVLFILLFIITGSTSYNKGYDKIVVKYVDFRFETPFRIDCANFDFYFRNRLEMIEITQKEEMDSLSLLINDLKPSKDIHAQDIRLKILLYKCNNVDTLCTGGWGSILNGIPMEHSKELMDFIKRIKIKYKSTIHKS